MRLLIIIFLILPGISFAKPNIPPDCRIPATTAITKPDPVDLDRLITDLSKLRTAEGKMVLNATNLRERLADLFGLEKPTSKLQQFYQLLYIIAQNSLADLSQPTPLQTGPVQKVLITARVFSNPSFPNNIQKILLQKKAKKNPYYQVNFAPSKELHLPLNKGNGFKSWEDGKCQHAQDLVFYGQFSFYLKEKQNKNLLAYDFKNVDLYGNFGTRGLVDVDLNYVELDKVEFIKNSHLGKVKAYISKKEFEKNKHGPLLKMVGRLFGNTSLQAIDW